MSSADAIIEVRCAPPEDEFDFRLCHDFRVTWWPVWNLPHADPEIGGVGAVEHYHIAAHRLPLRLSPGNWWHGFVIPVSQVDATRRLLRSRRVSPLTEPFARPSLGESGRQAFWQRIRPEGPVFEIDPKCQRCPHRGAPREAWVPDGEGRWICSLHGAQLRDRKGGDPAEWPADLRVREFPEVPRG